MAEIAYYYGSFSQRKGHATAGTRTFQPIYDKKCITIQQTDYQLFGQYRVENRIFALLSSKILKYSILEGI